jgi:hypothetical protein
MIDAGDLLTYAIRRNRKIGRWQGRVVGTIYIALGIRLAFQER